MNTPLTVADLCKQHGLDLKQLADKSALDEWRLTAILLGRWTPSPEERAAIAAVFNVTTDEIIWGHATPVQHIYGSGPG
jgi:transcriptional regulator with XRE-family HTH domain